MNNCFYFFKMVIKIAGSALKVRYVGLVGKQVPVFFCLGVMLKTSVAC